MVDVGTGGSLSGRRRPGPSSTMSSRLLQNRVHISSGEASEPMDAGGGEDGEDVLSGASAVGTNRWL